MKKVAKFIRVMTVAPFLALTLILILHFTKKAFSDGFVYLALFTLVLLPILAYPIQRKFHIIKGDMRASERKLAIIFSVFGYLLGFVISIIFKVSSLDKIVYLTYLLSGLGIFFFTFVCHINASGHMCGVAGPIAVLIYVFGLWYSLLTLFLIIVIWSSLILKRHKIHELTIGSFIPIIALILAIIIIK
ncbi:MAG: hypothetical protein PHU02_02295 [Bacilli bacterium]|jgi:hypothetical protein|nr:hypothetical protein [Bacilli bacterium]MDD2681481.1 hypothetical protein [Bacilli bacterium]MDD3121278.1 hypothetical protein [Bacilli bacterium]MDD4062920.1 hypothetical protein [Bacilli bacterium]MDD4482278.1 hypothetical protein [Bacilli bacterium]